MKYSLSFFIICFWSFIVTDQDLEPCFLSSVPLGTNFSGAIYGYSSGNILLNSLEIEDLNAKLNTVGVFYGRSFKLFNKSAKGLSKKIHKRKKEKYMAQGMDDYAVKPLDIEALKMIITEHCNY